jgi:hypothetical protein
MKADILKEYEKQIAQISMEHSGLGDPTCLDMDMQRLISSVFDRGFEEGKKAEIVICAAVKTTTGIVVRGHRHGDCMQTIIRMGLKISKSVNSQGFVTSKNRYVTREEGRKLQDLAGIKSVDPEGYRGTTLFSEDLY